MNNVTFFIFEFFFLNMIEANRSYKIKYNLKNVKANFLETLLAMSFWYKS